MAGSAPLPCSTLKQATATPQQLQSEFELGSQTAPQTAPIETGCAFRLSRLQHAENKTAHVTGLSTAQLACEHHCLQPCTACKEGTCQRPQMECCDAVHSWFTIIADLNFSSPPLALHCLGSLASAPDSQYLSAWKSCFQVSIGLLNAALPLKLAFPYLGDTQAAACGCFMQQNELHPSPVCS